MHEDFSAALEAMKTRDGVEALARELNISDAEHEGGTHVVPEESAAEHPFITDTIRWVRENGEGISRCLRNPDERNVVLGCSDPRNNPRTDLATAGTGYMRGELFIADLQQMKEQGYNVTIQTHDSCRALSGEAEKIGVSPRLFMDVWRTLVCNTLSLKGQHLPLRDMRPANTGITMIDTTNRVTDPRLGGLPDMFKISLGLVSSEQSMTKNLVEQRLRSDVPAILGLNTPPHTVVVMNDPSKPSMTKNVHSFVQNLAAGDEVQIHTAIYLSPEGEVEVEIY